MPLKRLPRQCGPHVAAGKEPLASLLPTRRGCPDPRGRSDPLRTGSASRSATTISRAVSGCRPPADSRAPSATSPGFKVNAYLQSPIRVRPACGAAPSNALRHLPAPLPQRGGGDRHLCCHRMRQCRAGPAYKVQGLCAEHTPARNRRHRPFRDGPGDLRRLKTACVRSHPAMRSGSIAPGHRPSWLGNAASLDTAFPSNRLYQADEFAPDFGVCDF
jgi:hypothetical protein